MGNTKFKQFSGDVPRTPKREYEAARRMPQDASNRKGNFVNP